MKFRLLALLLVFILILSGCSCRHAWTAADCTKPQICAKCQKVSGEPLGHSWEDATCELPQTCSRCGKTQGQALGHEWTAATCVSATTCQHCGLSDGQPLGHSYGSWQTSGANMTHYCLTCGDSQTVPYDEVAFCRSNLVGAWDFSSINNQSAYNYGPIFYLQLFDDADSTFRGQINGKKIHGTWYMYDEPLYDGYEVAFSYESEGLTEIMTGIYNPESRDKLELYDENYNLISFQKSDSPVGSLTGEWSAEFDGVSYSVTLMNDRSFYANLGASFHGIWTLLPERTSQEDSTVLRLLCLIPDESYDHSIVNLYIIFPSGGSDDCPSDFTWFPANETEVKFTRTSDITQENLDTLQNMVDTAQSIADDANFDSLCKELVGIWFDSSSDVFPQTLLDTAGADGTLDMSQFSTSDSDSFLILQDNGSFSGCLGQIVSGIWSVDSHNKSAEYGIYILDGTLTFSDKRTPLNFSLVGDGENLCLNLYLTETPLLFGKYTIEDLKTFNQGRDFLCGTWATCSYGAIVNHEAELQPVSGWYLSLEPDGSLTGYVLDQDVSGTWTYAGYSADFTLYSVKLVINGQTIDCGCNAENPALSFILTDEDGLNYAINIER